MKRTSIVCRILFIIAATACLPLQASAQIFVETPQPAQPQPATEAVGPLATVCTVSENLYRLAAAHAAQIQLMERYRDRQERITIQLEQQAKLGQAQQLKPGENIGAEHFLREPTECNKLDRELQTYISSHEQALSGAVRQLVAASPKLQEVDRIDMAQQFAECLDPQKKPFIRDAQQVLYACIYRQKNIRNVPLQYSVEKTMRRFFQIQEPLLNAWLGNVD